MKYNYMNYMVQNKKGIQSACDQAKRMKFLNSNNY